jgi:glycosyltransferase involved in cell wall biosynthesis
MAGVTLAGPKLSVVIPVLDEAPSLPILYAELTEVLRQIGGGYELIFVDDGSRDESFTALDKLHRVDDRVRVFCLRRNYGKAVALSVGLTHARGDLIVTLDADLQDDPAELPRLLAALDGGLDLVSGWKVARQDPISKRWPSRVFNAVTSRLVGLRLRDLNSGFKAYRREVVAELRLYGELHRFIPVLAAQRGFAVGEVPVSHRPRRFGRSKYGAARYVRGFLDLLTVLVLTRYTRRPLHLFGSLGLLSCAVGVATSLYLTTLWVFGRGPIGTRPLLAFSVLTILVGIQLISLGILSELVLSYQSTTHGDVSIRTQLG